MSKGKIVFVMSSPSEINNPNMKTIEPMLFLEGSAEGIDYGNNSIMFNDGKVVATDVWINNDNEWHDSINNNIQFDINSFTQKQRLAAKSSTEKTQEIVDKVGKINVSALHPLIVMIVEGKSTNLYHFADQNNWGSIYVKYHSCDLTGSEPLSYIKMLNESVSSLKVARRSVNDNCNYSRWRKDLEFERKFTFLAIPDTWKLINRVYLEILNGSLPGFVPEVGLEFQAFDYEVDIFDVVEPEDQKGYIAFIPQVDGRVCVKQKWFKKNAELRKETLNFNQSIDPAEYENYANNLCGGSSTRMPRYRRKRFDVNFESLETGNVFGIFFDICRTGSGGPSFSQCEVEYCRSRTWGPVTEVFEEFEIACDFAKRIISDEGVEFKQDLYSKLDFVREARSAMTA